jgi:hypothetical protein
MSSIFTRTRITRGLGGAGHQSIVEGVELPLLLLAGAGGVHGGADHRPLLDPAVVVEVLREAVGDFVGMNLGQKVQGCPS